MSQPRIAEELRKNLDQCLKCEADDPGRRFFSKEDLDNFWDNGKDDIEGLLRQQLSSDEERDCLKSKFSRTFCILLWIKFREASFPGLFDKLVKFAGTEQGISDGDLPLSLNQCESFFGRFYAQSFHDSQYHFLEPIYIDPEQFETYYRWHRLPYVGKPKIIGTGAFGQVSKVKILRSYCRTRGDSNDEDKLVAVKSFRHERDSAVESQNNGYLQGNILKHENILVHRAAVLHYDTFYIFMDLAPLGDLETLLSGGTRRDNPGLPTADQHYEVLEKFPDATRRDVLKAFRDLTAALKFLHHDVKSPENGESMKLAHNDLRPQNILIFEEQGQPIGRWKITDFGISTLKSRALTRIDDGQQVIGDLLHHPPKQARERSMEGPHRAPEFSSTIYDRDRKADLWSLGCVFAETIAFMQGFQPNYDRWSKSNSKVGALKKVYGRSFYSASSNEHKTTFTLKPEIREWLSTVSRIDPHYNECVGIACLLLRPDPDVRKDAGAVGKRLNRVLLHMQNEKPYGKLFELAREKKTLEQWCPPLLQRQTINLSELNACPPDTQAHQLRDKRFTLTLTKYAAVLSRETKLRSEVISVRPIEPSPAHELTGQIFRLPDHVQWRELAISGVYGCVTGHQISPNKSFQYLHIDLTTRQALVTDDSLLQENAVLKQAIPASNSVIAFCYDQTVRLRAFAYKFDESIEPPNDGTFKVITFNESGDKLFARISFHDKPRQDVLAIWEISLSQRPRFLTSFKVERPSQKVCRDDFHTILPFSSQVGGLMIYRNGGRGILFTALTVDKAEGDLHAHHQGETNHCLAPATTAAAVTAEYFAFIDVKNDMWLYRLKKDANQDVLTLEPLGSCRVPVRKASWFVLRRTSASIGLQLVVRTHGKDTIYDVRTGLTRNRQHWQLVRAG